MLANTLAHIAHIPHDIGEWIEVGGFQQGGSSQQSTILGSTRELSQDNRQILLKVDEVR